MSDIYDVSQVVDKTLVAAKDLAVYDGYPTKTYTPKQVGTVRAGYPAGIVYSWINADPGSNRGTLWWMFYPATSSGSYYFIPHNKGDFDISNLREQGVITVEEQQTAEDEQNKEWYEKVLDRIVPIALVAVLGAAAIRGYFSSRKPL